MSSTKARLAAVLVVIVAFGAGLFVGVAGDRFWLIRTHQFFPRRLVNAGTHRLVDRLDRELSLTAQQKTQIQQIVDRHHTRIESIMVNVRPQVRQEIDAANGEIEKVLTPAQREKYEKMRMHLMPHGGGRHGFDGGPPTGAPRGGR